MGSKSRLDERQTMFALFLRGLSLRDISDRVGRCTETIRSIVRSELALLPIEQQREIVSSHKIAVKKKAIEKCRQTTKKGKAGQAKRVTAYRCPGCQKLVVFRPCQICRAIKSKNQTNRDIRVAR